MAIILPKLREKEVLLTAYTNRLVSYMLQLTILPTAQSAGNYDFAGKTAVVIDVLRATSVITTALANGAISVFPAGSIDDAWAEHRRNNNEGLVCGEKDAVKIQEFHLGNSPLEFTPEKVGGKKLVLLTSNGTHAIRACSKADRILILSFLNLEAVSAVLQQMNGQVVVVCSGTNGNFSLDDGLCAGMLANRIRSNTSTWCDLSQVLALFAAAEGHNPEEALRRCYHVNYLKDKGFGEDVSYCLRTGVFNFVPVWKDGLIESDEFRTQ
jgi:2-phosphosulfolactate phosphatase